MQHSGTVDIHCERAASNSLAERKGSRVRSLDLVRGVAMILMAIDHVRVYSGIPAWGSTFGVFFTRWITNFSAPAFVFLAGTSAYLYGRRFENRRALSRLLLVRGAWLILLELTILRISWTFNFDYAHYMLAGVLWMIGWSMIVLAAGIHLPTRAIATVGVLILILHNTTDLFRSRLEHTFGSAGPNWLLKVLYFGGEVRLGNSGPPLMILYVLVPWVGLMFAGYAFGKVTERAPEVRRKVYLLLGIAMSLLFVALRSLGLYGDPRPWGPQRTLFGFLSTTKYPASLEFLLMTLGPMFLLWFVAERWNGRIPAIIETYGRVPMFFYLLHIPLIHLAACIVSLIREERLDSWLIGNHPLAPGPEPSGYMWSLALLYLVYAICLAALYFPCRWFGRLKQRHHSVWISLL